MLGQRRRCWSCIWSTLRISYHDGNMLLLYISFTIPDNWNRALTRFAWGAKLASPTAPHSTLIIEKYSTVTNFLCKPSENVMSESHQNVIITYGQGKLLPWSKSAKLFKQFRVTCDSSAILNFVEKMKKEKQFSWLFSQGHWAYTKD